MTERQWGNVIQFSTLFQTLMINDIGTNMTKRYIGVSKQLPIIRSKKYLCKVRVSPDS